MTTRRSILQSTRAGFGWLAICTLMAVGLACVNDAEYKQSMLWISFAWPFLPASTLCGLLLLAIKQTTRWKFVLLLAVITISAPFIYFLSGQIHHQLVIVKAKDFVSEAVPILEKHFEQSGHYPRTSAEFPSILHVPKSLTYQNSGDGYYFACRGRTSMLLDTWVYNSRDKVWHHSTE
ncbi:hypothetical protein [Prosthecobacter sp.]|jgi:hypothetical protein|uniref:hypothetical protein n=1 Tax=Prosthecobacter sp. TaxID=1965333 RepID=UPI003784DB90